MNWIQWSLINYFLRYLHLFSYIQRAQQLYNGKQAGSVAFNVLQKRRQLELRQRQQRQRQLQIRQQFLRRRQILQQERLRQQLHGENVQRKRAQRQTNDPPNIGQQQNVLQKTLQRDTAFHTPKNIQSSRGVVSQSASPTRAAFPYYGKVPQVAQYESYYSQHVALQKEYEDRNFPLLQDSKQQQSNPDIPSQSAVSPEQNGLESSSQTRSQGMEGNKMPANETQEVSLISVSKASTPMMQRPDVKRILPNLDQSANKLQYKLNSQTKQNISTHDSAFVSYHPTTTITPSGVEMGPNNRTGAILSKPNTPLSRDSVPNNLRVENQLSVSFKSEPPPLVLTKTAETQEKQILDEPSIYVFQKQQESDQTLISNTTSNSSEIHVNVDGGQNIQSQEKPTRKEKLFYFPIKRDTLIQMLPLSLQEKYRLLRDTRNATTSTQYGLQNITTRIGPSENISNIAHTIQQIGQPNEQTTVLNSSRNNSSSYGEVSNETRDNASIFIL